MTEELKPCPFCGGEVMLILSKDALAFIECKKCGVRVDWHDRELHESKVDLEAWNRRV